jgi:hypothetical protein
VGVLLFQSIFTWIKRHIHLVCWPWTGNDSAEDAFTSKAAFNLWWRVSSKVDIREKSIVIRNRGRKIDGAVNVLYPVFSAGSGSHLNCQRKPVAFLYDLHKYARMRDNGIFVCELSQQFIFYTTKGSNHSLGHMMCSCRDEIWIHHRSFSYVYSISFISPKSFHNRRLPDRHANWMQNISEEME